MAKFVILVFIFAVLAVIVTSVISYGGSNNFMRAVTLALKHGQLTIGAEPPTIVTVWMDLSECTTTAGACQIDPLANAYRGPPFRVTVRDTNGNCDTAGFKVWITLCDPTGSLDCAPASSRWGAGVELELDYVAGSKSGDGAECDYEWPSGAANSYKMDYWETPANNYQIYVRANDGANDNSDDPVRRYWYYTSLASFAYPTEGGDTIDYGTLSLDVMNDGLGDIIGAHNQGNVVNEVTWVAEDFCDGTPAECNAGTGTYLEINDVGTGTYPNYWLDDDGTYGGSETAFTQVSFGDTPDNTNYGPTVLFPSVADGRLGKCTTHACDGDSNAKFNIYYHLYIPVGQATGTYSNDIDITNTEF